MELEASPIDISFSSDDEDDLLGFSVQHNGGGGSSGGGALPGGSRSSSSYFENKEHKKRERREHLRRESLETSLGSRIHHTIDELTSSAAMNSAVALSISPKNLMNVCLFVCLYACACVFVVGHTFPP